MRKLFLLWFVTLSILCATLEAFSFASVHLLQYVWPYYFRFDFINRLFATVTNDDFQRFRHGAYDPLLGWDNKPNTSRMSENVAGRVVVASYDLDGARRDWLPRKANLISTYGDSFTACVEVDDRETWQFYLEQHLGYNVNNFGVAAYGTDQAVLKFEADVAQGEVARIAMLGLFEENINRILSRYRPFYEPGTEVKFGFKPVFSIENGHLLTEPNPLTPDVASLSEAKEAAERLIDTDYWARLRLANRFPYVSQLPSIVRIAWEKAAGRLLGYHHWQDDHAVALMSAIVDRFVAVAEAAGAYPVVLFIPDVRLWRDGRRAPRYESFKHDLKRHHPDVLVIDIAEHEFREDLFNVVPFGGHASAYGNRQIARILAQSLRADARVRQITARAPKAAGD